MRSRIFAGAISGLIAGVFFGILMLVMDVPAADRAPVPMMMTISAIVGSTSLTAGILFHLFNSIVIGAIFGILIRNKKRTYGKELTLGALYGLGWWIIGGLILMPLALSTPAFSPIMNAPFRPVVIASLSGHLIYGLVLAGVFFAISRRFARRTTSAERLHHSIDKAA